MDKRNSLQPSKTPAGSPISIPAAAIELGEKERAHRGPTREGPGKAPTWVYPLQKPTGWQKVLEGCEHGSLGLRVEQRIP